MNVMARSLLERLKSEEKLLLTTHRNPDPDGLGSEVALHGLLRALGKDVIIANPDQAAERLRFLDPEEIVQVFADVDATGRTVVIIDNSDLDRILNVQSAILPDQSNLIIIDHHDGATPDFHKTFQDPASASTSEIVYNLYAEANVVPSPIAATGLYAGLIADTGNFRYRKTSPRSHLMAAHLIELGVQPDKISDLILSAFSLKRLQLKKKLYQSLAFNEAQKIAYFQLDLAREDLTVSDLDQVEGVINELLEIQEIAAALFFSRRGPSLTRVSARSRGTLDLLPAVRPYDGGGHKNACGATIHLDLQAAIADFLPRIESCLQVHAL
ncbi:MAG: bifunctional oligoribonuclease/PAP phosphatase NrnA [Spirochaetales bacterium]|nr:bifunctional oligoribonuclease/PAP phosphatase NrnA [Spirochaetales bacterium]